ncbi:Hypothetical predicted protein [Paramuricea clavata]|uniref:Uncharacterized protein n=1 Tax=Paramuricea clavata TaxID=317549 RepID=A0A7D9KZP0_PARCT|nr:Hypothetical predicted protein [Paramuricea clavata]
MSDGQSKRNRKKRQHQTQSTVSVDIDPEDEESDHCDQLSEDELLNTLSNDLSVPYIPAVNTETNVETEIEDVYKSPPPLTENETNKESEWVFDYLDRIQDVLQDEIVHTESEMDESDDDELWYARFNCDWQCQFFPLKYQWKNNYFQCLELVVCGIHLVFTSKESRRIVKTLKISMIDGILSDQQNISFMWNTDVIPVFKLSKLAIWPLYCIVNELPYAQRIRRSNMIFAGPWFGSTKPNMLTYFKPFHSSLRLLETEGIRVGSPEAGTFISRAILLAGTCDLPAKCLVCNTVQFNGFYGCSECKQPGESVRTDKGGTVLSFPFSQNNPKGPPRMHQGTIEDAKEAVLTKKPCDGVKGPSWLAGLKHDIIKGT